MDALKILRHQRTNGRASREEKVHHQDLALDIGKGHGVSNVIDQFKVQDAMVLRTHGRRIHQCRVQLRRLVNGQVLLRLEIQEVRHRHRSEKDDDKRDNACHGQRAGG